MFKYLSCLLACVAIIFSLCSCADNYKEVGVGQEFFLSIGEGAQIEGENLEITFEEIIEDSRCPRNVTCVWAGRVSCVVEIKEGCSRYRMVLVQPGLTDQPSEDIYKDYSLAFKVEPYPETGREIADSDYRLYLTVSKS